MLTIEMKVNGTLVGQIYAHNETGYMGFCDYKWHCYLTQEEVLLKGMVTHQRQNGFLRLQAILTDAVIEELEKLNDESN